MTDHYDQREALYDAGGFTKAAPKLQDFEAAMQKLRGTPPAKWMLIAPDGRAWVSADPLALAEILDGQVPPR